MGAQQLGQDQPRRVVEGVLGGVDRLPFGVGQEVLGGRPRGWSLGTREAVGDADQQRADVGGAEAFDVRLGLPVVLGLGEEAADQADGRADKALGGEVSTKGRQLQADVEAVPVRWLAGQVGLGGFEVLLQLFFGVSGGAWSFPSASVGQPSRSQRMRRKISSISLLGMASVSSAVQSAVGAQVSLSGS